MSTIEEDDLLSEPERFDMVAMLKAAEERIAAGEYAVYDPDTFVDDRLMNIRASAIRRKYD